MARTYAFTPSLGRVMVSQRAKPSVSKLSQMLKGSEIDQRDGLIAARIVDHDDLVA
jgi:hypothetical protein